MAFVALVGALLSLGLAAGNPFLQSPYEGTWGPGPASGHWGSGSSAGGFGSGGAGGFASGSGSAGAAGFAPIIIEQVAPSPITVGLPLSPDVIDHQSAPYEINYFGTPYLVKHKQSAALNVFSQTPVVVDTYAEPQVHEQCAEPAIVVEEVCPNAGKIEYPCY